MEFETDKIKKLKAQRAAIDARMRQEQYKLRAAERKIDTRRKVLAGAWALDKVARDNQFAAMAMEDLRNFLTRDDERALFGLPPLPERKTLTNQ